jgi:hypothetical protein
MSLDFTMGESRPALADGSYYASFTGTSPVEAKEHQGKMLDPGIRWEFTVNGGPNKGAKTGRITQLIPTPANGCGRIISGLLGRTPTPGEKLSLADCVGKTFVIVMKGGRVDTVSPPPQQ